MESMKNRNTFLIAYIGLCIITYVLPYLGSNSPLVGLITHGINPFFWVHLAILIGLCMFAWNRGKFIGKKWILAFSLIALFFDLAPIINWIPFVPSIMHILVLVFGSMEPAVVKTAA